MVSGGGGGGGVRVQQPLRRWQEQRLRAQARIRRLRHFPTSSSSVDPCSAALSLFRVVFGFIARLVYGLNGGLNCLLGRVLGKSCTWVSAACIYILFKYDKIVS